MDKFWLQETHFPTALLSKLIVVPRISFSFIIIIFYVALIHKRNWVVADNTLGYMYVSTDKGCILKKLNYYTFVIYYFFWELIDDHMAGVNLIGKQYGGGVHGGILSFFFLLSSFSFIFIIFQYYRSIVIRTIQEPLEWWEYQVLFSIINYYTKLK